MAVAAEEVSRTALAALLVGCVADGLAPSRRRPRGPSCRRRRNRGLLPRARRSAVVVLATIGRGRAATGPAPRTAQADNLNPRHYNVRASSARCRMRARRSWRDPARGSDAERGVRRLCPRPSMIPRGIIYVDPELRPTPPSARELLNARPRARRRCPNMLRRWAG